MDRAQRTGTIGPNATGITGTVPTGGVGGYLSASTGRYDLLDPFQPKINTNWPLKAAPTDLCALDPQQFEVGRFSLICVVLFGPHNKGRIIMATIFRLLPPTFCLKYHIFSGNTSKIKITEIFLKSWKFGYFLRKAGFLARFRLNLGENKLFYGIFR